MSDGKRLNVIDLAIIAVFAATRHTIEHTAITPVEIPLMEIDEAQASPVSHVSLKQEINLPIVSG